MPALAGSVAVYVVATSVSIGRGEAPAHPFAVLALAVILPTALSRIVLGLRDRLARWPQTLSALFGTSGLLSLLALPIAIPSGTEPPALVVVASLVLFFWSFAVDAHIWRNALDTSYAAGMAVAVLVFAVSMVVITSLAGPL